jgi:Uma2 family endonuclease
MHTMPRVPPFDRPATYDDLVALPEPLVAEIVDGELHASPRPAIRHARAASLLGSRLLPPMWEGRGGPGGWWILDEPELHLHADILVPDLAGWRRSRLPRLPDGAFFTNAPDWVCEVLSPSTAALDRSKKLAIYAREAVLHAWLVDPLAQTLEVLLLEGSRWSILATHVGYESVRVAPFEHVEIPLSLLFGDD